jgi:hypothetical protein
MISNDQRRFTMGDYTAIEGKLDADDARRAETNSDYVYYVIGPVSGGRRAPIASFWFYEEAVRYVRRLAQREEARRDG